jgi:aminocarboxymuconate-semialdehyde decarboxylase
MGGLNMDRRRFLGSSARLLAAASCLGFAGQTLAQSPRREIRVGGRRARTIDIHAHTIIPGTMDFFDGTIPNNNENLVIGDGRIEVMDRLGIDIEILSINPFWYGLEVDPARRLIDYQNKGLAEVCARYPDRLMAMATVALQHPELAAEQLETGIRRYGFKGVSMGGSVAGEELGSNRFDAFWSAVQDLDVPIFLHPQGVPGLSRLQGNGYLTNVIGNPLDTTIALSHMIFEGVFDRFPRLKVVSAHGGGYLASYADRSDYGCRTSPASCTSTIERNPTEYLRDQYYDSLVFTSENLRHLVAQYGAGHIMIGSDYPYPWTDRPVDHVLETPGLSDADKIAILGGNAMALYGIPA